MSTHTLHRENCSNLLRKSHTTICGNTVALYGKHGFEWTTAVTSGRSCCFLSITKFPTRKEAQDHYKLLCESF